MYLALADKKVKKKNLKNNPGEDLKSETISYGKIQNPKAKAT
jgi:hypothetical protein